MSEEKIKRRTEGIQPGRIIIGAVLGVILTLFVYLVISVAVFAGMTSAVAIKVVNIIVVGASALIVGFSTSGSCKTRCVLNGVLGGLLYYLAMTVIGMLSVKRVNVFNLFFFEMLAVVLFLSFIAAVAGNNRRKARRAARREW